MSSTYSSDETQRANGPSSTEALAARYRHLFVLPSKGILVILTAAASLALSFAGTRGHPSPVASAASLLFAVSVPFAVSGISRLIDTTSIATYRRSLAVTFAGTLVWLTCTAVGLVYAFVSHTDKSVGNSLIFGAFLCGGFEILVINGAFIERVPASVCLGSLHPAATLGAILLAGGVGYSSYAALPAVVAFAIPALFTISLKRKKTSRGHNSIKLFQAFMKTWASDEASDLEAIIASHADKVQVSSKVLRFQHANGDLFVVLPGVHPGPFYPVGSYNLPGLISRAFEGTGPVLTLHRPGGHERNLATNASAKEYSRAIKDFAEAVSPAQGPARIQGPLVGRIGRATATASAFAKDMLLTISFAPHGSDDLELDAEKQLTSAAATGGYGIAVVDAHNSIDEKREALDPNDPQWLRLIQDVKETKIEEFRIGYAHSRETDFPVAKDITANGLGLAVLEVHGVKWVLALADANNAVPNLRGAVSAALESSGYRLLEFCTSDSHDLAARGLTVTRGYLALGEVTPLDSIAGVTVNLAKLAETRLSGCMYGSGTMMSEASVFGARALQEFARIAQESSRFAKRYAAFAAPLLAFSLVLSLVL
ncbi:MAG: DUF2070 family protein [Nitrososphaerales archaeon]|nr:DUF2070 family protein [Nitrososphaerales archaeon]